MSIYATIGEIGIRRFGDKDFVAILIQGVPPHIDSIGPRCDFLPPPVDPKGSMMRAVFFVEPGDEKGTDRCGQEYLKPLLMLTGAQYDTIRFTDLMRRLEAALEGKYGPRPPGIAFGPDERLY